MEEKKALVIRGFSPHFTTRGFLPPNLHRLTCKLYTDFYTAMYTLNATLHSQRVNTGHNIMNITLLLQKERRFKFKRKFTIWNWRTVTAVE